MKFDAGRYSSGLDKDRAYRELVDSVLERISENLAIPYQDLYSALFFKSGSEAKGILVMTNDMMTHNTDLLVNLRKEFEKSKKGSQ